MELDRTKCFKQGGYDLANSKVIVQFSDLSVYEYQGLTLNQWLEWKESYPRGRYFNHHYRYSGLQFKRLNAWPDSLFFTFIES